MQGTTEVALPIREGKQRNAPEQRGHEQPRRRSLGLKESSVNEGQNQKPVDPKQKEREPYKQGHSEAITHEPRPRIEPKQAGQNPNGNERKKQNQTRGSEKPAPSDPIAFQRLPIHSGHYMLISTPAPNEVFFRGRPGDLRLGEWVSIAAEMTPHRAKKREVVLIGYPDDQGVKRNRGRAGAALGPDAIRKHLYRMTVPADRLWEKNFHLYDLGNSPISTRLPQTHAAAQALAAAAAMANRTGICLGGGHDFAAPTFLGFQSSAPNARWGLINIDPHLDTRELEGEETHSGNPFRVLLESGALKGRDFTEFGARTQRNTRSSWEFCRKQKVNLMTLESIRTKKSGAAVAFHSELGRLGRQCKQLGVTIDMDSCSETEGSSAAPVLGFSSWELCCFASIAGKNPKVRYLEIAEVAPSLEPTERASRIASEILYAFLDARSKI